MTLSRVLDGPPPGRPLEFAEGVEVTLPWGAAQSTGAGWEDADGRRWVELRSIGVGVFSIEEEHCPKLVEISSRRHWEEIFNTWQASEVQTATGSGKAKEE